MPSRFKSPRLNWRAWSVLTGLVLIALLSGSGFSIARTVLALRRDYETLRPILSVSPAELTQSANIAMLETELERGELDLRAFRKEAALLLEWAKFFGWIPVYGSDIEQAPALTDYAIEAVAAARMMLKNYRSLQPSPVLSNSSPRSAQLLRVAGSLGSESEALKVQLARTAAARERINDIKLSPSLAILLGRGDRLLRLGQAVVQAPDLLPQLLGVGATRRYLVVAQNIDELRATGGYISGVGIIEIRDGRISEASYEDSYAVEDYTKPHPWPPKPLTDYMSSEVWVVRDANWSPDFPTSAKTIEELYALNQGMQVDGVVAINLTAVQRFVAAFAPVDVPGYGVQVDEQNMLEQIQSHFVSPAGTGQTGDWWSHRKDFMAALMEAIVLRLNGEERAFDVSRLGQAVWTSLSVKDMQIYLNNPKGASVLNELGWDGSLPKTKSDVVLVVDSNVGFNKVDARIQRQFDYRVEFSPGERPAASLRIRYRNTNSPAAQPCVRAIRYEATYVEMQNGCYWDYLRVYVPEGSLPIAATQGISATVESAEQGHLVFGGFFELPRAETREIRFDYQLPFDSIQSDASSDYQLVWIKQPGVDPVSVHVTIVIPASLQVINAIPAPSSQYRSTVEFLLPPDRDSVLRVRLGPAPPYSPAWMWGFGGLVTLLALILLAREYLLVARI